MTMEKVSREQGSLPPEGLSGSGTPASQAEHAPRLWSRAWVITGVLLWLLGVAAMIALALLVYMHPQPFPFELSISKDIQETITWPWLAAFFRFLTLINNPLEDTVTVIVVMIVFAIMRWFRQGIFWALAIVVGNGVDALIGDLVARPRPTPNLIHVDSRLIFNSFPSGHSCHMMVFYGFLFFLTLTGPVSRWRYHWLILLLQIWALLNICLVGFARLWEGEHWMLDVFGGYLDGAIWMSLFIFLYLLTTRKLQERRIARQADTAIE